MQIVPRGIIAPVLDSSLKTRKEKRDCSTWNNLARQRGWLAPEKELGEDSEPADREFLRGWGNVIVPRGTKERLRAERREGIETELFHVEQFLNLDGILGGAVLFHVEQFTAKCDF